MEIKKCENVPLKPFGYLGAAEKIWKHNTDILSPQKFDMAMSCWFTHSADTEQHSLYF